MRKIKKNPFTPSIYLVILLASIYGLTIMMIASACSSPVTGDPEIDAQIKRQRSHAIQRTGDTAIQVQDKGFDKLKKKIDEALKEKEEREKED